MKEKLIKSIQSILNNTEYLQDVDFDGETANEVIEYIEERIQEEEVIYYGKAIKFLSEEDDSLTESTELACGMGYTLDNVNSELLATILTQSRMNEELYKIKDAIEEVFDEFEEEEEEE